MKRKNRILKRFLVAAEYVKEFDFMRTRTVASNVYATQ